MNNIALGGIDPRSGAPFAYYETLAGGAGASRDGAGQSAVHSHMTNTQNTPVEALEYAYPLRVTRYGLRPGSGGAGRNRGGDGLVREIELLAPAEVMVLSERRTRGAWGLAGGEAGAPGINTMLRGGVEAVLPGKVHVLLGTGDRLRVATRAVAVTVLRPAATPGDEAFLLSRLPLG
jgi:N-methylhydantoinase B